MTQLPLAPARIPISELIFKEAVGFALWNGKNGTDARLFLRTIEHPDFPEGIIRFFGGTSVPFSSVPSWNQSLIQAGRYLNIELEQEFIVNYIALDRRFYLSERVYSDPRLNNRMSESQHTHNAHGNLSHEAPGFETHGIIPVADAFISQHNEKLISIHWHDGSLQTNSPLPFANEDLVRITNHLMKCANDNTFVCQGSIVPPNTGRSYPVHIKDVLIQSGKR